jgi:hypothetical protein
MNEELEIIKNVVTRLNSAGIDYMLTGSMAMAFYAAPRMTRDIDIIINVSMIDVERIVTLFQNDFYIDAASIRQAVQGHGMFNAIHTDSIIKVDFIVRKDEEYRIEEFSRKRMIDLDGLQLAVAAPEDLVLSKLIWAHQSQSDLQMKDVRLILQSSKDLDMPYLEKWSQSLGVKSLLRKAQENA